MRGSRRSSPRARPRLPDPVARLAEALTDIAGAPVALERPARRRARRLRDERRAPARAGRSDAHRARSPTRSRREARRARCSSQRAEAAGPGFVNLRAAGRVARRRACAEILSRGDAFGARLGDDARAHPGRDGVGEPDRADHRRLGPERRVRRLGRARCSRSPATTVEREYYYNDAGAQMERFHASVEAVRRGEEPPEDGYHGDYIAELAALPGDPVPAMLERIEATLERFRVHFDTWERQSAVEAEIPEAIALLDTFEEDGALWARTSAHGDDKDRVLVRSDGDARRTSRPMPRTSGASTRAASTGSSTSSAPTTTATSGACRRSPRCSGTRGSRSRCSSTSSSTSSRAARRRRCRSGAATSCSSTSSSTRSASTRRAGTSSRAVTTRRSSSTSISRRSGRRRIPSTTSSTRTRGSPGSSATRQGRRPRLTAGVDSRSRSRREERELVKRLLEFPRVVARGDRAPRAARDPDLRDPRRRRLPSLLPPPPRARVRSRRRSGSRSCRATQLVIARCLDLVGVEAPERM